jgi:hypothetical protein
MIRSSLLQSLLIAFACCIFVIASSVCNTTQITSRRNESNSIPETSNDLAGTYRLIAVNVATIPATVSHGDAQKWRCRRFIERIISLIIAMRIASHRSAGLEFKL